MLSKTISGGLVAMLVAMVGVAYAAEGPAGEWAMTYDFQGEDVTGTLIITENDDGTLSGTWNDGENTRDLRNVSIEDGELTFNRDVDYGGTEFDLLFVGTIDGDAITGGFETPVGELAATGTRGGGGGVDVDTNLADLVGLWDAVTVSDLGTIEAQIEVRLELRGWYHGDEADYELENLKLVGNKVSFNVVLKMQELEIPLEFSGSLDEDLTLTGQFISDLGVGQVTAHKSTADEDEDDEEDDEDEDEDEDEDTEDEEEEEDVE